MARGVDGRLTFAYKHPVLKLKGISRNVVVLGFVSLLNDVASEMLYPVIPLFLTGVLGASPVLLGLIEGLADGGSTVLRWIAGILSDRYRTRKPFVVWGYGISAISKPVMGLAGWFIGWPLFLAGRCVDRLGKSVRTSARDALIADSTDERHQGVAFGFHRAMDTIGAICGPLAVLALILLWPHLKLHLGWLFVIALIPGLACTLLAQASVVDIPHAPGEGKPPPILQAYPAKLWWLMLASFNFSLGNSSDSFLIVRSREMGLSFEQVVMAYALYNAVNALAATPLGKLSDTIGRKPVIVAGWLIYAAVYFGFAAARAPVLAWALLGIYGLYQALTDGVTKAMIADVVPKAQRAGAIGLYYTITGVAQLAASLLAGKLWNVRWANGRLMAAFAVGAVFSLAAAPMIALIPLSRRPAPNPPVQN